jgi:hypothetical protein
MIQISLELEEWQRVLALLATGPWNVANPLLMKIGDQLRVATTLPSGAPRQGNNADLHDPLVGKPQ